MTYHCIIYVVCCIIGTIQLPKLCMSTVQIPQIGIIFVHHGGVMTLGEQLMWLCFNINIMGNDMSR